MNVKHLILVIGVCIALAVAVYFMNMKRKETWFSRDRDYGKMNVLVDMINDNYHIDKKK